MVKLIGKILLGIGLGVAFGLAYGGIIAQSPSPVRVVTDPRFFISDLTEIEGGRTAYVLHDRKVAPVCFLVIEGVGGMSMAPRMC